VIDPKASSIRRPTAARSFRPRGSRDRLEPAYTIPEEHFEALKTLVNATDDSTIFEQRENIQAYLQEHLRRSDWLLNGEELRKKRNRTDKESLIESILDLTNYEDDKLLTKAFCILHRIFNSRTELCSLARKAQLHLVPSSVQLVQKLNADLPILRRLAAGVIEESEVVYVVERTPNPFRLELAGSLCTCSAIRSS
jgi:hypothetical protein